MTAEELLWQEECARHGIVPIVSDVGLYAAEKDASALSRHLNAVVPVSYACVGDRIAVSSYQSISSDISCFLGKFGSTDALFSDAAFGALDAVLRPYLAQWGYRPSAFPSRYGISLVQDDASAVPTAGILSGTTRMTEALRDIPNRTSMRSADCIVRGAYAQIVDGAVVCMASVNRVSGAMRCVEIGVECAPQYRRRGYARSCVCALTRFLCEEGHTVLYRHYHTNAGSAAVAASAGFRQAGRFFAYTSFAI